MSHSVILRLTAIAAMAFAIGLSIGDAAAPDAAPGGAPQCNACDCIPAKHWWKDNNQNEIQSCFVGTVLAGHGQAMQGICVAGGPNPTDDTALRRNPTATIRVCNNAPLNSKEQLEVKSGNQYGSVVSDYPRMDCGVQ